MSVRLPGWVPDISGRPPQTPSPGPRQDSVGPWTLDPGQIPDTPGWPPQTPAPGFSQPAGCPGQPAGASTLPGGVLGLPAGSWSPDSFQLVAPSPLVRTQCPWPGLGGPSWGMRPPPCPAGIALFGRGSVRLTVVGRT